MNTRRIKPNIQTRSIPLFVIVLTIICMLAVISSYLYYYIDRFLLPPLPKASGSFPSEPDWIYKTVDRVTSSPVASGDRIIIRTLSSILALDADTGSKIWETRSPSPSELGILSVAPVVHNEFVIVPEAGSNIALISLESGRLIYRIDMGVKLPNPQSATIEAFDVQNDILLIARFDWKLTAYDLNNGEIIWEHDVPARTPLYLDSDDTTIFLGAGKVLQAYRIETGEILWRKKFDANVGPILFDNDKLLMALSGSSYALIAIDAASTESLWKISREMVGEFEIRRLAVSGDLLLVASDSLYAFQKADGKIVWMNKIGKALEYPIVIRNQLFIRDTGKIIYMLDLFNGSERGRLVVRANTVMKGMPDRGPVVIDDLIIVPFGDNRVIAYHL